jgi:hypothetical protein
MCELRIEWPGQRSVQQLDAFRDLLQSAHVLIGVAAAHVISNDGATFAQCSSEIGSDFVHLRTATARWLTRSVAFFFLQLAHRFKPVVCFTAGKALFHTLLGNEVGSEPDLFVSRFAPHW